MTASDEATTNSMLGNEDIEQLWLEYGALSTDADRKRFIDRHVVALTETYALRRGQLRQATRIRLIEFISDFRDPRTEPALRTALQAFVQERPTDQADADIKWVLRAAAELKLPGLSQPLIDAFHVFEAHTLLGGVSYKDFARAMFEIADPSWAPVLRAKLTPDIRRPKTRQDIHLIDAYRDQLFWQTCAGQVLGIVRDREAVEPLFRVLLDPEKLDIATTALLALVKIGRPARTVAAQLLSGKHPELAEYREQRTAAATGEPLADAPEEIAAMVLGTSGHIEARAPLLEFLKAPPNPESAVYVAKELAKVPPHEASKTAFATVLSATPKTLDMAEGTPARAILLEAAAGFYDPLAVEWCLDTLRSEVAPGARAEQTRSAGLTTALSLVDRERLPRLRRFADAQNNPEFQQQLGQVTALLDSCKENAACYLDELSNDSLPKVLALKAGTMVGVYGDASSLDPLVGLLGRSRDAAVRFVLARTLDHLLPTGSPEVLRKLQQIIESDQASGDPDRMVSNVPIREVMARLEGKVDRGS